MNTGRKARLAKRFVLTFALVAGAVGVASLISGHGDDTSPISAAPTVATAVGATRTGVSTSASASTSVPSRSSPQSSPGASASTADPVSTSSTIAIRSLPAPNLDAYCGQVDGAGASAGEVDDQFDFACALQGGGVGLQRSVDDVCASQFDSASRRVSLIDAPQDLRCVPPTSVAVGRPDWDRYCRRTYGATGRSSTVASDQYGWRCVALPHGVYEEMLIDFDTQADWVCQVTVGGESFAASVENVLDGWRCYEVP